MQPECNDIAITGKDTYNNYNQGPPIIGYFHSSKNFLPLPPCIVCNVVKSTIQRRYLSMIFGAVGTSMVEELPDMGCMLHRWGRGRRDRGTWKGKKEEANYTI